MISKEVIELALREKARAVIKGNALVSLEEAAQQRTAEAKAGANGIHEDAQAALLEVARLEHEVRFASLKGIVGKYRDDLKYFRDRYFPSSKIFTWELYGKHPYGPAELGHPYDGENMYFYTEGFFLEEPAFSYGVTDNSKGAAFMLQAIATEDKVGAIQKKLGIPRVKRTHILAQVRTKQWMEIIYPLWEHVVTRSQEAEGDFYSLNGYVGGGRGPEEIVISLVKDKGVAQTPYGFNLFSPLPFKKDWIPWEAHDTGRKLEQQIVTVLEPSEIKKVTG